MGKRIVALCGPKAVAPSAGLADARRGTRRMPRTAVEADVDVGRIFDHRAGVRPFEPEGPPVDRGGGTAAAIEETRRGVESGLGDVHGAARESAQTLETGLQIGRV